MKNKLTCTALSRLADVSVQYISHAKRSGDGISVLLALKTLSSNPELSLTDLDDFTTADTKSKVGELFDNLKQRESI